MKVVYTGFYTGPGLRIAAVLRIPEDYKEGEKRGGIVVCEGYAGFKEMVAARVATTLTEAGYVTVAFDYRGFGSSEGPRWRLIPMEEVEDIRNAMTFLQTRPEVNAENVGLWGTSLGGGLVVYTSGIDDRVKCTVSNVGFSSGLETMKRRKTELEFKEFLEEMKEDRFQRVTTGRSKRVDPFSIYLPRPPADAIEFWKMTRAQYPERMDMQIDFEYFEKIIEFKPIEVVDKISPRPIMFTYAQKDALAPDASLMYEKAKEPKKIHVFNVDHHEIYKPENFNELMKITLEWFNQWMR